MPTLPGLTTRLRSTSRTKGMWVCPQTTVDTDSFNVEKASAHRSSRLSTSTTSSSSRGVAWQNRVVPSPSISIVIDSGRESRRSIWSARSWPAAHGATGSGIDVCPPRASVTSSRWAFPRTHTARSPKATNASSVSTGCGPAAMSPVGRGRVRVASTVLLRVDRSSIPAREQPPKRPYLLPVRIADARR